MIGRIAGAIALALGWISAASAAPVRFDGQGTIASRIGNLPSSGTAVIGDPVKFSFVFDTDGAQLVGSSPFGNSYTVTFSDFSASVGGYTFTPSSITASLGLGRGFAFFGGSASEPSLFYNFTFSAPPRTGAPFVDAGIENFRVSAVFRDLAGFGQPVSLADLRDPSTAQRRLVTYAASRPGGPPPQSGFLDGSYTGGFSDVAGAVPEPASWALMIIGFGGTGFALRRRTRSASQRRTL